MNNKIIKNMVCDIEPIKSTKEQFKQYCCTERTRISTGYTNFDISLGGGLTDELYIFGAPTSTGKSAFWMSIAQNIAESDSETSVLYFSLEMSKREFIARGTSMITFEHKLEGTTSVAYTNSDILGWRCNKDTGDFEKLDYSCYEPFVDEYYQRYGDNLYIIDNEACSLNADRIFDITVNFRREHLDKPFVVIVDYLQIGGDAETLDRKSKTDNMVTLFKRLSTQMQIPVICISSVSRDDYKKRVSLSSFKESGNIEYGGGICLGWNWYGETVAPSKGDDDMLKQFKREGWRLMDLNVLKSRNGARGTRVSFKYIPAYNFFEEICD